jgi:hypothetical protein
LERANNALPHVTGAVYKKRAGVISRHHDDTMMRDENRVKTGVVQWQNGSFPSFASARLDPRGDTLIGVEPAA